MKAKLIVDMDNAAFDSPGEELAIILRELASKVKAYNTLSMQDWVSTVRDTNGNKVGTLKITGRRD